MKSFRTFLAELKKTSLLTELTDNPYPLNWEKLSDHHWTATFATGAETTDDYSDIPPSSTANPPATFQIDLVKRPIYSSTLIPTELQPVLGRAESVWEFTFQLTSDPPNATMFTLIDPWGINPSGGQHVRILSTIVQALREFVANIEPDVIGFSAKESSRVKLYQRFVRQSSQYLRPRYVGSGPYPEEAAGGWLKRFVGKGQAFVLVRGDLQEQMTPVTSELHD